MISSTSVSPVLERGPDTMVLVYSLLQGHPASTACEQLLRAHSGWFTSPLVLFETKAILTKVYGEDPAIATKKLAEVVGGPLALLELDPAEVTSVFRFLGCSGVVHQWLSESHLQASQEFWSQTGAGSHLP